MGGLRTRSFFALILALPTLARQTAHARRQVARTAPALISTTHGIVVGRADATPYPTSTRDEDIGNFDVSDCHLHGTDVFCTDGATEYQVQTTATATEELPAAYTGCHGHGKETFCFADDGGEVQILSLQAEESGDDNEHDHEHDHEDREEGEADEECEKKCHFHAGVEHCICVGSKESSKNEEEELQCARKDRYYNIPLRVGLTFAILVTSAIGVFSPIFLHKVLPQKCRGVLVLLRQFGTGVVVATAFVHLFTHAVLMFQNPCLGELEYEATAAAIVMAGLLLSFLIEYIGQRYIQNEHKKAGKRNIGDKRGDAITHHGSSEALNIFVMEAGILFHSLLIGLTLAVAGDSFFLTLFLVIVFHQFFEGVALGSRLATVGTSEISPLANIGCSHHFSPHDHVMPMQDAAPDGSGEAHQAQQTRLSSGCIMTRHEAAIDVTSSFPMWKKMLYASLFALVTPIGMAIGIAVLNRFNGNDPSTIIVIGSLDAFSAGILIWVGVVEMWAGDWMGGEMSTASPLMTGLGLSSLLGGMVLMSLLGKWA